MEILTEADKKAILEAAKDLEALEKEIARAKRAGIDVAAEEERLKALKAQIEGLRRVYIGAAR
ncbi:MAG: hypothetical protein DRP01_04215 [Archaeoglobales archaeon]|nr:MAG: hypothetical protein DRP01_04215 [Archaeoglobales archaeon]